MGTEEYLLDKAYKKGYEIGYQKGLELARLKFKNEVVPKLIRNNLRRGKYSPEQLASFFDEPLELVLSIKDSMDKEGFSSLPLLHQMPDRSQVREEYQGH